jgi:hypothetical protein
MNRRAFIQGVLSLAALGPLARVAAREDETRIWRWQEGPERLFDLMRPMTFEPLPPHVNPATGERIVPA